MPKIKSNHFDADLFDELLESENKSKKKKKKKYKKGTKKSTKKKNKSKKKKKKNNKKKSNKKRKQVEGYINSIESTSNQLYRYKYNKNILHRILDKFDVSVDSNIDITIRDESIAALINVGAGLFKSYLEKKLIK